MEQTANIVSFPGLGWEFEIDRVAFHIGSLPVYWYGILIALGFILAILYVTKRAKEFGVDPDRMLDVVLGGAIGGIVGARAYFVLLRWDYYGQNLDQIFNTRSGGMAIYGGLIGGSRQNRRSTWWSADSSSVSASDAGATSSTSKPLAAIQGFRGECPRRQSLPI